MKKKRLTKNTAAPHRNAEKNAAVGKTLIIAAGGTGGHITPGISIAEAWLALGGRIIFATLTKNIDYPDIVRLARDPGGRVAIVGYDAPRLTKNPFKLFSFLKRFRSAVRLLKQAAIAEGDALALGSSPKGVDAVLGMGGYSSFPAVWYAIFNHKPLFLCEQNAHWGIVTRFGRLFARAIFLSFKSARSLPEKFIVTGNPLRAMFRTKKPTVKKSNANIFFIGGSQGASDINALYHAFSGTPLAKKFHCTVATGNSAFAAVKAQGRKVDTILPFIEDMPAAYQTASFIVARCGSGTLFEILWSQKPAFLIPYPFAAANHQRANAEAFTQEMACVIFDERPFNANNALGALTDFLRSQAKTENQTGRGRFKPTPTYDQSSANAGIPAAEIKITRYILQILENRG